MVSRASLPSPPSSPALSSSNEPASRFALARASLRRLRDIAAIAATAGVISQIVASPPKTKETDRALALAAVLGQRGLAAQGADVQWVDPPRGVTGSLGAVSRAIVRARTDASEAADLYLAETRLSPEGVLLGVGDVHNLTETSGAEESRPVVRGERFAFVTKPLVAGASETIHLIDLRGQNVP